LLRGQPTNASGLWRALCREIARQGRNSKDGSEKISSFHAHLSGSDRFATVTGAFGRYQKATNGTLTT
jgi:hypothetical protein